MDRSRLLAASKLRGMDRDFLVAPRGRSRAAEGSRYVAVFAVSAWATYQLAELLFDVSTRNTWLRLVRDTFWGMTRVLLAVALSTLWTVPIGIWIGTSPESHPDRAADHSGSGLVSRRRCSIRLALGFLRSRDQLRLGSMFLMMLGVQWYVLFNVLAGAMKIPQRAALRARADERPALRRCWRRLYLPASSRALVTGWVMAAGGGLERKHRRRVYLLRRQDLPDQRTWARQSASRPPRRIFRCLPRV